MAAIWRTEPIMDSNERQGPQIYVHVEFGVSWTKKPPKNHEITYRSRNMRERTPHFPRQVPAPNTNYLAAIHTFEQQQTRARHGNRDRTNTEVHHARREDDARNHHQMQEYYQAPPPPYGHDQPAEEQSRPSRAESRSHHERGRSAPPPIGENPWDVNVLRREGSGEMSPDSRQPADHWKALPANPSQFRLGEGGMPWSAWSWPFEYQPETPSYEDEEVISVRSVPGRGIHEPFATSPTMVSTFSPEPSTLQARDTETGRTGDLGALSAAMMTVDNGFENQWWNQGQRETVTGNETETLAPEPPRRAFSSPTQGWSALETPAERQSSAMDSIVSPITAGTESSPQPAFQSLYRTLSTRSEELFFMEGR